VTEKSGKERRKHTRVEIGLPVRVQGRAPDGDTGAEMSTTEDTSAGGIAFHLKRTARIGQVMHVSLPFPKRLRKYDLNEASYRSYVLVRNAKHTADGTRVGVMFLGKSPPRGAEALPSELFLMPGDPVPEERRKTTRWTVRLAIKVETGFVPPGSTGEEVTIAEDIGKWGAQVPTSLPLAKGDMVRVTEVGGDYTTRAEVRNVNIPKDGRPRLNLLFLDEPAPERLLPPIGADETKGKR
jgi:hypothetical protein